MASQRFRRAGWVLLVTLLCLVAKPLPAQKLAAEDAVNKALETAKDFEFIESPLLDVVDRLKEMYQIPIVIDEQAVEDSSVGTDRVIAYKASDTRLRSALNLMLPPIDLGWVVVDGYLIITTRERADRHIAQKVQPVHHLVSLIKATIEQQSWICAEAKKCSTSLSLRLRFVTAALPGRNK